MAEEKQHEAACHPQEQEKMHDCCKPQANHRTLSQRLNSFLHDKECSLERIIFAQAIGVAALLLAMFAISFFTFFGSSEEFFWSRGIYMVYLILAVAANGGAILHFRAYKGDVSCSDGMMIGMTVGMMASFMVGAAIGATNGIFVGSVVAVAIGLASGVLTGKCCGIMGIMEGMMAGLMGGLMGPMTSVMMYSDNLLLFMPILFGTCLLILFGLTYMNFSGGVRANASEVQAPNFAQFFTISFVLCAAVVAIMAYGPRSALFAAIG
jgi:hypothetical protein